MIQFAEAFHKTIFIISQRTYIVYANERCNEIIYQIWKEIGFIDSDVHFRLINPNYFQQVRF